MSKPSFYLCFFNAPLSWSRVLPFFIAGLILFLAACADDGNWTPPGERSWFYEREFKEAPTLFARPDQTVILQLDPAGPTEGAVKHSIPFNFDETAYYYFRIDPDDPCIVGVTVTGDSGTEVLTITRETGEAFGKIRKGQYVVHVYHDGSSVPPEGTAAFIRLDKGSSDLPRTVTSSFPDIPYYPAYVALRIHGGRCDGDILIIERVLKRLGGLVYLLGRTTPDDRADYFEDRKHLFSFEPTDIGGCRYMGPNPGADCFYLHTIFPEGPVRFPGATEIRCADDDWLCPSSSEPLDKVPMPCFMEPKGDTPAICISSDRWTGAMVFWFPMYESPYCSPLFFAENYLAFFVQQYPNIGETATFSVVDGVRWYTSEKGVDPATLGSGEVVFYGSENYRGFTALLSAPMACPHLLSFPNVTSLRFGYRTDTTVRFTMQDGSERVVGIDTPALDLPVRDIQFIDIFRSRAILIGTKKCPGCNLAGADLSAPLNLDGADLSGANLLQADLEGTSLRKGRLPGAVLGGVNLNGANLEGANLSRALLNGQTDTFGHHIPAASAEGAFLRNVNLRYADLSGVNFSHADIYGTASPGICNPGDDGFTDNCACASQTTMNATNFTNAWLANLDMSDAVVTGGIFTDAVLCGATLAGATLQADNKTGTRSLFGGAFLQGAVFTGAKTFGADFTSAYADLTGDDECRIFRLTGDHTGFTGYWNDPSTPECVAASPSRPTIQPATGDEDICPDGNNGPCSDDRWGNPRTPIDQSKQKSGRCDDDSPLCDIDWPWMTGSL